MPEADRTAAQSLQTGDRKPVSAEAARGDYDGELMLQLRAGVREAGDVLLQRNGERVARFIARVVRDPRMLEDLTQDVFLQVIASAPRYEPTARFSTWLYRVATNVAINHLHSATRRKRERAQPEAEPRVAAREPGPERKLSVDEVRDRVSGALDGLPVNQRIALTLRIFDGFSYEQIAAIMGCSEEAVRGLLTRARDALRHILRDLAD